MIYCRAIDGTIDGKQLVSTFWVSEAPMWGVHTAHISGEVDGRAFSDSLTLTRVEPKKRRNQTRTVDRWLRRTITKALAQ